jgi:ribosomal protein S18 acetylase RimI-like enzyme
MAVRVRELTIDHYDAVYELWRSCEGIGLSKADSRENIELFLFRNPGLSFIAEVEGELAGAVLCGSDGRRGFLYHLAVAPAHRRGGIGSLLVHRCLQALADIGLRKCHIFVLAENHAGRRFWQRIGWEERTTLVVMSHDVGAP